MKESFELNEELFLSIHPSYTTSNECAIPVTVYSIVSETNEEETFIKKYQVGFGTLDEPEYVDPDRLYKTKNEAIKAMREELENDIVRHQSKIDKYSGYLKSIID